jgi:hypothetical protein
MKKLLFMLLTIVSMASFLLVGCQKDLVVQTPQITTTADLKLSLKDVKTENGYLVFQDVDHFISSMQAFNALTSIEQMKWYEAQEVKTLRFEYLKMLKEYELLSEETDVNKISAFQSKNSHIASFKPTGEVDMNIPIQYAQMVNQKGLLKIGKMLIHSSRDKTVYIMDGDINKLETALRMNGGEKTTDIVAVKEKTENGSFLRGTCIGQAQTEVTISSMANSVGSPQAFKTESSLVIKNWGIPVGITNDFDNRCTYFAVAKSYKRGAFGIWFTSSLTKECKGSVIVNPTICPPFPQACGVTNPNYSDVVSGQSEVLFPIAGAFSYYTTFTGSVLSPSFWQSCSDNIQIITTTSKGPIIQNMQ